MPKESKAFLREGAMVTATVAGVIAYWNYRMYLKKQFLRSEGWYRMGLEIRNCTPWKQMYFTWWRMPVEEFTANHRFMPYYIIGQLDLSKEILIPRSKIVAGRGVVHGYDVVNPLYCYEGGRISMRQALENKGEGAISIDRSALIVVRGWIPAEYKDKRSRPQEAS